MMRFYDKERSRSTIDSLSNALSKRDNTTINTGGINMPMANTQQQGMSFGDGASKLMSGAKDLYGGLKQAGLFNNGNTNNYDIGNTLVGGNYFGSGSSGSMTFDNIMGNDAFNTVGSSAGFNAMPLVGNALGGLQGYANTGDYKDGIQGFFGTGSDDSDVMQGIKGTANGAMTGLSLGGPVGAAIGAALGLGASFVDDLQGVVWG